MKLLVVATILSLLGGTCSAAETPAMRRDTIRLRFDRQVQNIEAMRKPLGTVLRDGLRLCPDAQGETRFGRIPFRVPGEPATSTAHFLDFAVVYDGKPLPHVLVDLDRDGNLACTESADMVRHPADGTRAMRTIVTTAEGREPARYRLTVPAEPIPDGVDEYGIDLVDVPVAKWRTDAGTSLVILFDGNYDGVFTRDFGDGVLVDATGKGNLSTDPYAGDFHSYRFPIQLGAGVYRILEVQPDGSSLALRQVPREEVSRADPLQPGDTSEAVRLTDADGKSVTIGGATGRYQLVQFWLSRCGSCEREMKALKPVLARIEPSRLAAVGVSLDVTESDFRSFVDKNRPGWPQCYVGAMFWDNPVAVKLGAVGPSDIVLLDPEGKVLTRASGVEELLPTLERIFGDLHAANEAKPGL